MGIQDRRERERLQQRQKILDAALDIISKEGFAALSMRKLADRIEYSAASIYLYFKNREQIAQELSDAGFQQLLDSVSAATSGRQPAAALQAMAESYVAFGLKHPEIYRLIFMGDSDYMDAAWAEQRPDSAGAKTYSALLELAGQLQASGLASRKEDRTIIAETIWCTLHGIVSLRIACAASQNSALDTLLSFATQTLLRGLNEAPGRVAVVPRKRRPLPASKRPTKSR